ncbi:hypothetical protein AGMMS49992_28150 [Clostridia bacterium]|nr:hypothetical protein AGMMS49992_28150 [Clostridia bacterium]
MNNCFAYKDGGCEAREDTAVCQKPCPFFKTNEQHDQDILAVFQRINQLDFSEQVHIAAKYYVGRMPWLKEGRMTEFGILLGYLALHDVEHYQIDDYGFKRVRFMAKQGYQVSAIFGEFSYGYKQGLLETMILDNHSDAIGYRTAIDIIEAYL